MRLKQLRIWLKHESWKEYGVGRKHVLHLWDWEVKELLEELEAETFAPQNVLGDNQDV